MGGWVGGGGCVRACVHVRARVCVCVQGRRLNVHRPLCLYNVLVNNTGCVIQGYRC